MTELTLQQLDALRREGLRPNVVACIVYQKKILFLYHEEYKLWGFAQGGVDNHKMATEALWGELSEEVGEVFLDHLDKNVEFLGYDQIDFPSSRQGSKELRTDAGKEMKMRGKFYLFYLVRCFDPKIDVRASQFDGARWVSFEDAAILVNTIYQKGKKRIIEKALQLVKSTGEL